MGGLRFALVLALLPAPALALDASVHGYGALRLVAAPATDGYLDGGLGKLRFGDDDGHPGVHLGDIVGELTVTGDSSGWSGQADGRLNAEYGPAVDLLEGFVRYAPPSDTNWHWAVRAGAFFAPLSLENEEIGWSSFWTVTPSAIDSWVGAELRTLGAEGTLQWRSENNALTLVGAAYGWNDPAGVMIAERGWTFDDRVTGLFEKTRLPDAVALASHRAAPLKTELFADRDGRPGWYLDLSYEIGTSSGFEVMRYDNQADPSQPRAWHTKFWDVGFRQQIGAVTILAQGMSGDTLIRPAPARFIASDFNAAYLLAGWDLDDVWLAARTDVFQTRTWTASVLPSALSEDGHAFDITASWRMRSWLRLSAEYLLVEDRRAQRLIDGDKPQQTETQFQLVARGYF